MTDLISYKSFTQNESPCPQAAGLVIRTPLHQFSKPPTPARPCDMGTPSCLVSLGCSLLCRPPHLQFSAGWVPAFSTVLYPINRSERTDLQCQMCGAHSFGAILLLLFTPKSKLIQPGEGARKESRHTHAYVTRIAQNVTNRELLKITQPSRTAEKIQKFPVSYHYVNR